VGLRCPGVTEELTEAIGYRLIAVASGVLVDHRGARAGVAESCHEFLDGRAGGCGQGATCVAQIVEVGIRHASRSAGIAPYRIEVVATKHAAFGPNEDQARPAGRSVSVEMLTEFGHNLSGERDSAIASA
jgi:hypothetical protein